jgi:hypothetical protein
LEASQSGQAHGLGEWQILPIRQTYWQGVQNMKSDRMKKWLTNAAFFIFSLALIAWTASLTLGVMDIVLPHNPYTKYFALALFDGGVITWLFTFIDKAKGTPQRGVALSMTVADFAGVAMMVMGAIYLGGQSLTDIPDWMGRMLVNVTIGATLLNLGAVYYYHASDPQVREAMQAQELEDDLNEEALEQAHMQIEHSAQQLGAIIANRVTARLKYRLRLPMTELEAKEWQGETIDVESYDMPALQYNRTPGFWDYMKSFFGGKLLRQSSDMSPSKNSTDSQVEAPQDPQS